jgi:hypothetical protein
MTVLICAYLLSTPLIAGNWRIQIVLEALLLTSVLITGSANEGGHRLLRMLVGLWLLSILGTLASVLFSEPLVSKWYRTAELLTSVPLLGLLAVGMLMFVRQQRELTVDSIFATVAAYLMLSLLFTQIYLFMTLWNPASFSLPTGTGDRPANLLQADLTYFSMVTMATVGYGDVLPSTHAARMVAMFQAVVGQFYIAVVVAMFVGMYSSQRKA